MPTTTPHPDAVSRRDFLRLVAAGSAALAGGLTSRTLAEVAGPRNGRKLGVALVGLGNYSTNQLRPALLQTKLCRLTGMVSGRPEVAARWARELGLPASSVYNYDNFDRIADNPDIDIVYVVTPPALHADTVVRAAKAGKHVICEKPLATTVADCDTMIAACRAARVKFSVGYRLHFDPYHLEMMRLAHTQELGIFKGMAGEHSFRLRKRIWRINKKLAGGGPMMDMGIYVVHGAIMAQDGATPVAVTAYEEPKEDPELFNEVEESMRFTMEFANGAQMDGSSSFDRGQDRLWLHGTKGWMDFPAGAFSYRYILCGTSRGPLDFSPPVNQQALQMDDFADCILTGRETPVPGEMGRRDIRILTAIYEAARTGQRVLV
jgi:glucose-fructose oxidoreductase